PQTRTGNTRAGRTTTRCRRYALASHALQKQVSRAFARDALGAFVAESWQVDAVQQMLAAAEQHGPQREGQPIDETGPKILTDRRHAPANAHVAAARSGACLLERGLDAPGDETKLGAACHLEGRPRMMGEHEHRCVIGRLIAPPALPTLIRPRPA